MGLAFFKDDELYGEVAEFIENPVPRPRTPEEVARQMIGAVPMRRYGSIEEIPGTVMYLMSDDASYVTGVNIYISGGIR